MDEQQRDDSYLEEQPTEGIPENGSPAEDTSADLSVHKRRWLTVVGPIIAALLCFALIVLLVRPLSGRVFVRSLPVTGSESHAPNQASPKPALTPDAGRAPLILAPGETYRSAAEDNLIVCLSAFHDFYVMEEVAAHQPDLFASDTWRADVTGAMRSFRTDCQTLGRLPPAPRSYQQLERWLKLAAAEVTPATESFSTALDKKQIDYLSESVDHMDKFVEYTHNAEQVINGLDKKREL